MAYSSRCSGPEQFKEVDRLFEPVVAKKAKRSLPMWVQKPFLALCLAPVSSTVIQEAEARPRAYLAASARKVSCFALNRAHDLPLGDIDAQVRKQCGQSRDRDLPLVVLAQDEALVAWTETAAGALGSAATTVSPDGRSQRSRR